MKKRIIFLISLLLILVAIPFSIYLIQKTQILKSKALGPGQPINIPSATCDSSGNCSVTGPDINVLVTGPKPPQGSPSQVILTPQQQGWHFGPANVAFEWQYHWVKANGYWAIFSVGQTQAGSALLIITGDPNGLTSSTVIPGTLTANAQGFDIQFNGNNVTYRGTQNSAGDRVVITSPQFSFDGTFSSSQVLWHGTIPAADGVTSPDYYSRQMLASGTMTISGVQVSLQSSLSENDHQYGVVEIGISPSFSKLAPLLGQDPTIYHDWVYITADNLAIAAVRIKDRSTGSTLASYVLVQKQGEALQRATDVTFTPSQFESNNFAKKIQIRSTQLQLDMQVEIPRANSFVLGNILQEDGGATITGTLEGQQFAGSGIKESTDNTGS